MKNCLLVNSQSEQSVCSFCIYFVFASSGLLTEIQCKSKRLRKNTKASSDESIGDDVGDSRDAKQIVSTTKPSKVRTQVLSDWVIIIIRGENFHKTN